MRISLEYGESLPNIATNQVLHLNSDDLGNLTVPALQAGTYVARASKGSMSAGSVSASA